MKNEGDLQILHFFVKNVLSIDTIQQSSGFLVMPLKKLFNDFYEWAMCSVDN